MDLTADGRIQEEGRIGAVVVILLGATAGQLAVRAAKTREDAVRRLDVTTHATGTARDRLKDIEKDRTAGEAATTMKERTDAGKKDALLAAREATMRKTAIEGIEEATVRIAREEVREAEEVQDPVDRTNMRTT